ncbi:hypothetical protein [Streptomyces bauhiniae]|uniref:hypothetical protein n=1 Tax=Streptomyces bauhiniae TaxID=2340725 RepID=UPI001FCAE37C|nr:hypothetical protein [Streptomyces bauhiniae]
MITGLGAAMLLLPVAACSAGHSGKGEPAPRSAVPSPHKAAAGTPLPDDPSLTSGSAVREFGKGKKGDALFVEVRCRGKGTMNVVVRPVRMSFPVECSAGKDNTVHNEMAVAGADGAGTVVVTAPSAVRWALTVGHATAAQAEPLDLR